MGRIGIVNPPLKPQPNSIACLSLSFQVCTACGSFGHIARDCKNPRPGGMAFAGAFGGDESGGLDDEVVFFTRSSRVSDRL